MKIPYKLRGTVSRKIKYFPKSSDEFEINHFED